jgi:hypothetical protein
MQGEITTSSAYVHGLSSALLSRVARLYIFKPKLGKFGRSWSGRYWYIYLKVHLVPMRAIWYICGHLVYLWPFGIFVAIWYICGHLVYLWPFGIFVVERTYKASSCLLTWAVTFIEGTCSPNRIFCINCYLCTQA